MKRLLKVDTTWSANLAYAVGLISADGCLSSDGRHIEINSKDKELIEHYKFCINIDNKIGKKSRGRQKEKKYYRVQFGDINFYEFLVRIGLTPAKSKTIERIKVPNRYYAEYFRGVLDGDGNINVQSHPESMHPQLRVRIFSASPKFLDWLKEQNNRSFKTRGGWIEKISRAYVLSYGKEDSIRILNQTYKNKVLPKLMRKYMIAKPFLNM